MISSNASPYVPPHYTGDFLDRTEEWLDENREAPKDYLYALHKWGIECELQEKEIQQMTDSHILLREYVFLFQPYFSSRRA